METLSACTFGTCKRLPDFSMVQGTYESYDSVGNRIRSNNKTKLRIINNQLQNLKTQGSATINSPRHHLLSRKITSILPKKRESGRMKLENTFVGLVHKSKVEQVHGRRFVFV